MAEQVTLDEKIAYLASGRAFPDRPDRVETIETHFAWVFLSPQFVYKLKKPIRFGLIDFREREARHAYCELEVTLNRRLAEAVYQRVVPLLATGGDIVLGNDGAGETVDWLVEMRRLPDNATLADASRGSPPTDEVLARIAEKLIDFYARTPAAPWDGPAYVEAVRRSSAGTADDALAAGGEACGLPTAAVQRIATRQLEFVERHQELLAERAAGGRVVDAHGDLRAEHVFLTEPLQIIDCLEFSVALRWLDAAEEVSFLALDCDRLGLGAAGERLLALYQRLADDPVPEPLLLFYGSRRALARAVLAAWRVPEASYDAVAWRDRARWYLDTCDKSISAACRR